MLLDRYGVGENPDLWLRRVEPQLSAILTGLGGFVLAFITCGGMNLLAIMNDLPGRFLRRIA